STVAVCTSGEAEERKTGLTVTDTDFDFVVSRTEVAVTTTERVVLGLGSVRKVSGVPLALRVCAIEPQLGISAGQGTVQLPPCPLSPLTVAVIGAVWPPSIAASEDGCSDTETGTDDESLLPPPHPSSRPRPQTTMVTAHVRFIGSPRRCEQGLSRP